MQSQDRSSVQRNRGRVVRTLVLCCLAVTAPSAAAEVGDSATGLGTADPGESFNFAATGGPGESATGTMQYQNLVYSATAVVDCLRVEGNRATVGGTIIASTILSLVGNDFFFRVEDNGPPGAGLDRFEESVQTVAGPCLPPATGFPVTSGDIVVVAACDKFKEHKNDPGKNKCKDKG